MLCLLALSVRVVVENEDFFGHGRRRVGSGSGMVALVTRMTRGRARRKHHLMRPVKTARRRSHLDLGRAGECKGRLVGRRANEHLTCTYAAPPTSRAVTLFSGRVRVTSRKCAFHPDRGTALAAASR